MKVKAYLLSLTLLSANVVALRQIPVKRGRVSTYYHKTCNKLSNHKGKACFAGGAIAGYVVNKVFKYEINAYVKPFFKSVFRKIGNFFKRVFKVSDKENIK